MSEKSSNNYVDFNLKIEIRPIPNRNKIAEFSENLEYFSQPKTIAAYVNPVTLKYKTGLTEADIKYLKDKKFSYPFEDASYVAGVPHPFWESNVVKTELKSVPIFLFPGRSLMDFIKWKYLLESEFVYSSEQEMKTGIKPQATHFIYNEGIENAVKASKIESRNKLIKAVSNLTTQKKKEFILILLNEDTDNKNEDYLSVRFEDILNNPESCRKLEELLEHKEEYINVSALVKLAVQKNVLVRTKKGIFYFETNLGYTESEVVDFLLQAENQSLLIIIKEKVNK